MSDLFKEIIPSILMTKKDVLEEEKDYIPYVVNRALSQHMDCLLYVQQMNLYPELPRKLQYHYFLNTIRPMKRKFQPWQKKDKIENLECVKEYFGYSDEKARQALHILNNDNIAFIKKQIDKGGVKND